MTLAAVLTGDLIGSTEVDPSRVEHTIATLAEAASVFNNENPSRFTRYRGDGWQINLKRPGNAVWAAVYLNACLKADPQCLNTRIAIGIGTVESLGAVGLAGANGTAFVASGRSLDSMTAGQTLALAGEKTDAIQRSLLNFLEHTISGWSREQAIDYSLANEGGRREDQVPEIERYMANPGQALKDGGLGESADD